MIQIENINEKENDENYPYIFNFYNKQNSLEPSNCQKIYEFTPIYINDCEKFSQKLIKNEE